MYNYKNNYYFVEFEDWETDWVRISAENVKKIGQNIVLIDDKIKINFRKEVKDIYIALKKELFENK